MSTVKRFEELEVWKKVVEIGSDTYKITRTGLLAKDYITKDQLIRAALSISNNNAEGFEYNNNKDFIKFLRYAKGSSGELRNIYYVIYKSELIDKKTYIEFYNKLDSLSKQIQSFIKYLQNFETTKKKVK
jgi:four helix bundle protein